MGWRAKLVAMRSGGEAFRSLAALNLSNIFPCYISDMWFFAIVGLIFPRLAAVALYFLTSWFSGVFATVLWSVLGFIFAAVHDALVFRRHQLVWR